AARITLAPAAPRRCRVIDTPSRHLPRTYVTHPITAVVCGHSLRSLSSRQQCNAWNCDKSRRIPADFIGSTNGTVTASIIHEVVSLTNLFARDQRFWPREFLEGKIENG